MTRSQPTTPALSTDQIVKQTGFSEGTVTSTKTETDPKTGATVTTSTDASGKTMTTATAKDGSSTQTTVKDKDGKVLADQKTSALDTIKQMAPTLLENIAAGAARDLVLIGGTKLISKVSKEVAEKGVKSALQQGGKLVAREGAELSMKFLGYMTFTGAQSAAGAAAELGLRKAGREAAQKVIDEEVKKAGKKALSEITDKAARKAIQDAAEAAAEKAGKEAIDKAAKKTVQTAVDKAMVKGGEALAKKAATVAAKEAVSLSLKAEMGPVGWALMALDVVGLALDIACCGGYCEVADTKTWEKERNTYSDQIKALVEDANKAGDGSPDPDPVRWPIITGPFDKLESSAVQQRVIEKAKAAMADPNNKFVKDVMDKLKKEISDKKITTEDQVNDFLDKNMDMDGILLEATSGLCTELLGKVVMENGQFTGCSWPDQQKCEASFQWGEKTFDKDKDIYSSWNKDKQECNKDPLGQLMNTRCDGLGFPYDKETKICKLSKEYCLQKGLKWDGTNCKLEKGQEIAEMMFGTTVVRGLNSIYSADQYEPCPSGSRPAGEIAALAGVAGGPLAGAYIGQTMCASDKCPDGQDRVSGLCYDQCKPGYDDKSDGITGMKVQGMCYKCPDGFKKTTAGMCERIACPPGQERGSGLGIGFCYKKCSDIHGPEYTESDGASICKKPCPAGMTTDALTCRREPQTKASASADKTCPPGWSQTIAGAGGMCQQDCTDGYKKYLGLCYHPNVDTSKISRVPDKGPCNSGDRDDGTSCWSPLKTSWDSCAYTIKGCKKWGKLTSFSLFNDTCKEWGDVCQGAPKTTGGTIVKTLMQRQSCPAGYTGPTGGFCYAVSKPVPVSKPLLEVGQCNDPSKPEAEGGKCYQKCSDFGGSFKRSAVGLCQMDLMVTERTKTRQPEGPFLVAKPADQYAREPNGISYKVFPKKRKIPFGKGPNGC